MILPTTWNGVLYRSRTEARWACFFDSLGLRYEYEPEGFGLPSCAYLPDFFLPQVGMWGEVKPIYTLPDEERKCRELTELTGKHCLYLLGAPTFTAYYGSALDCGEITTCSYSLDIHMHDKAFLENRLFACPPYAGVRAEFSPQYRAAVDACRNERFGVYDE